MGTFVISQRPPVTASIPLATATTPGAVFPGNNVDYDPATGRFSVVASESLVDTFRERTLQSFRTQGGSDQQMLEAAVVYSDTGGVVVINVPVTVFPTNSIIVKGGSFKWRGWGNFNINGANMNVGRVNNSTQNTMEFPQYDNNRKNLDAFAGSLFIVPGLIYELEFRWGTAYNLRFVMSSLYGLNRPLFSGKIENCDCGVWCYGNGQVFSFVGCSMTNSGVLFIGAATASPIGSPWSSDFCFVDALSVYNQGIYNAEFQGVVLPDFDRWFRQSFIRQGVDSRTGNNVNNFRYKDANDVEYPETHEYVQMSGRIVSCPFRNGRDSGGCIFGLPTGSLHIIGSMPRGAILMNTQHTELQCYAFRWEDLNQAIMDGNAVVTLGSLSNGKPAYIDFYNFNAQPAYDRGKELFHFTGVGGGGGLENAGRPYRPQDLPQLPKLDVQTGRQNNVGLERDNGQATPGSGGDTSGYIRVLPHMFIKSNQNILQGAYYSAPNESSYVGKWAPFFSFTSKSPANGQYLRVSNRSADFSLDDLELSYSLTVESLLAT